MITAILRSRAKFAMPVLLAAVAGVAYAAWSQGAASSGPGTSTGGVPVSDDDAVIAALVSAQDRTGFTPLVPSHLPTSADRLVLVDASVGPPGTANSLRLIELVYRSAKTSLINGVDDFSTLEMFQTNVRINDANGQLLSPDLAGYEVHRDVVSADASGDPIKVTYTARAAERTFVMDFTGDQPDQAGLRRMLESLAPFKR